jgi:hypothetical protein
MRYILLIYGDEGRLAAMPEDERHALYELWDAYAKDLGDRGVMRAGDELSPTTSATTVKETGGQILVTDGPFAETKEQLGGYFIVEVDDLDTAIELAKAMPAIHGGSVEIRPVVEG